MVLDVVCYRHGTILKIRVRISLGYEEGDSKVLVVFIRMETSHEGHKGITLRKAVSGVYLVYVVLLSRKVENFKAVDLCEVLLAENVILI